MIVGSNMVARVLAILLFFSGLVQTTIASADVHHQYFQYREAFYRDHYRDGLVAIRYHCRDNQYGTCGNIRNDSYNYPDSTYYMGWLLAILSQEYSRGLLPRAEILQRVNEVLDTLDRLSKYSTKLSISFVQQTRDNRRSGWADMIARKQTVMLFPSSGFLLRDDVGVEFDELLDHPKKRASVEPSLDQYTGVLFGLVMIQKTIPNPIVQQKVLALSNRIRDYMISTDFELTRPWDDQSVKRGGGADTFKYTFLIALSKLTGKPIESGFGDRIRWLATAKLMVESAHARCDEAHWFQNKKIKCNYFNHPLVYIHAAFASMEPDAKLRAGNQKSFEDTFLNSGFLAFDLSPILALVTREFYGINNSYVTLALSQLDNAPLGRLPNTWEAPGISLTRPGKNYYISKDPREPVEPTPLGVEATGLDYLLTWAFRR